MLLAMEHDRYGPGIQKAIRIFHDLSPAFTDIHRPLRTLVNRREKIMSHWSLFSPIPTCWTCMDLLVSFGFTQLKNHHFVVRSRMGAVRAKVSEWRSQHWGKPHRQ